MNAFNQKGIGLVEVIVALLLLAIGVLGFSMLQMRAMNASLDASKRIQAMNLARDLSERMRANKVGLAKTISVKDGDADKLVDAYANALSGKYYITSYTASCADTSKCDSKDFAQEDVNQVLFRANTLGMKVALNDCPGPASNRYCVFVAWDETLPIDGSSDTSCTKNGSFLASSKCIVLEAY
ncbi:type IV pilus modification protein PilV [Acinetobacter pragensis]|uniref:Type IV pilus modification protein PilV n=1 Tax=Acinetobacter pragensis TaxID=1806892 RepID=A0A151Y1E1_9GAMM|nr:type IV pilus modification protein PilV [Acinetobacter pragensis]KYQ71881.1 type IV pilus modification protein PilV [Acinetobacter pragensis]